MENRCKRAELSNKCAKYSEPTLREPGPFLINVPCNHSGIIPNKAITKSVFIGNYYPPEIHPSRGSSISCSQERNHTSESQFGYKSSFTVLVKTFFSIKSKCRFCGKGDHEKTGEERPDSCSSFSSSVFLKFAFIVVRALCGINMVLFLRG